MTNEELKTAIKERIPCTDFLTKARRGEYICPYCDSGNGKNATGALHYYQDTNTFNCFSCNKSGDIIDLYRQTHNADYGTAIEDLAAKIGIQTERKKPKQNTSAASLEGKPRRDKDTAAVDDDKTTAKIDYTKYYQSLKPAISFPEAQNYLKRRGIGKKYKNILFDPEADPAQAGHKTPRIIIPISSTYYYNRRIDDIADFKSVNPKGSQSAIFNLNALHSESGNIVYVTEGVFDALAVMEVSDYQAIALNGTGNADKLTEHLKTNPTDKIIIVALDSDSAGQAAAAKLQQGLTAAKTAHISADINGRFKDPNEHLIKDKEAFTAAVKRAPRYIKADSTDVYIDTQLGIDIYKFKSNILTGFKTFDSYTDGLHAGLYVLAATSSLGKTTYMLQMADQIAAAGNDVIFVSLEQSKLELVTKSIARYARQVDDDLKPTNITSLSIRKGQRTPEVLEAIKVYRSAVKDKISIVEGNFNCNVLFIREYVENYIRLTKSKPVLIIDYLQIIQPIPDFKGTQKEHVDVTVTELKRISRDLTIPVIVVSSINRANYLYPIDYESLKESGGIEYSCDCLFGFQLQVLDDELFTKDKHLKEKREKVKAAKEEIPRKIKLTCLKNRYGATSWDCLYDFNPIYDLFTEADKPLPKTDKWIGDIDISEVF